MSVRVQWEKSDDIRCDGEQENGERGGWFFVSASGAKNTKPYQKCRLRAPRHEPRSFVWHVNVPVFTLKQKLDYLVLEYLTCSETTPLTYDWRIIQIATVVPSLRASQVSSYALFPPSP